MKYKILPILTSVVFLLSFSYALAQTQPAITESGQTNTPRNNYADIPDEYIEEAIAFGESCKTDENLRQYHDCECLAVKYLDERIKRGPRAHSSSLMLAIEEQCPDATEAAGIRYEQCIQNELNMPQDIPIESFCTCYANTFAELFEAGKYEPGSDTTIRLQTTAMIECNNPAKYPLGGQAIQKASP
jgi:hypothetical protein